ncbi:MAG: hypothetical protein KHW87_06785 [Clostridiales bacterium]|nr:hypothetical protein [Clostridiales bacterium]
MKTRNNHAPGRIYNCSDRIRRYISGGSGRCLYVSYVVIGENILKQGK